MNNFNKGWIAIIVCILIASGSICFGVIQGQSNQELERLESHEIAIAELKIQTALIKQELAFMNLNIVEIKELLKHQRD